jgi:two-component system, cell cycle sensor histidine kinase and response regulator CckA
MTRFMSPETQLAEAQRIARVGSWEWDRATDVVTCSHEMRRLLSLEPDAAHITGDRFFAAIQAADVQRVRDALERVEHSSEPCTIEHAVRAAAGQLLHVQTRAQSVGGSVERLLVGTTQDISERRDLEQQLRHAQKMEALGRLAGGVAHDFNNLLAGISCNAELLLDGDALSGEQFEEATEIRRAAERAALLTRQLLAFSRKQGFRPEVLDLNIVVRELERMLRRLLSVQVQLTCVLDSRPCWVEADRGQLEQALVNLVVNARDAMPNGGIVTIETRQSAGADADTQIALIVRDTGVGIDQATQERLFEPFFTTKSPGQGTGLGLAMVYGIVQQAGGSIRVLSAPGQGAEFRLLVPRSYRPAVALPARERRAPSPTRGGTVLLIEDEAVVLDSVRRTLTRRGYRVIEARQASEAMRAFELHAGEIELVLSDAIMPGLGGPELLAQFHARRPELPLVLMSGYTRDSMDTDSLREIGCWFIEKPFSHDTLLGVLDQAMGAEMSRAAAS